MEPERTCIGCGTTRSKLALGRMVLDANGFAELDGVQKKGGRGAYVCGAGCLRAAVKRGALGRAFKGRLRGLNAERLVEVLEVGIGRKPWKIDP